MSIFLLALLILTAGALASGVVALKPDSLAANKIANIIGPTTAVLACLTGLAGLAAGGWSSVETFTHSWGLPFGAFALGLDPLSRIFLLPVFILGIACALSGHIAMRHADPAEHNLGAHWLFYLVLLLGMCCVMTARDCILFMLAWELMSLSPFFLIDFNYRKWDVQEAAWVYLVAAHLGAVLLIAFFALLWEETGSTLFADCAQAHPVRITALFVLAMLGFGAKAGMAPLHVWLPEAHPAAPSHVSALLSGAMLNAGLYGIIRSFDFLGPVVLYPAWWGWALAGLGVCTALMGILKALAQTNLKRLLAYSSVENMGLMILGVGIGLVGTHNGSPLVAALGFSGCLFHMLNHSAFKGLLFLCAGEVLHSAGTVRMDLLGGLQKRLPVVGGLFALGAASIACLPPFNGFAGEFVLSMSLVQGLSLIGMEQKIGIVACLVGLMLVSGISSAVYIKAYGITFLGQARSSAVTNAHEPKPLDVAPLFLPAAICVAGGLGSVWFFKAIQPAVAFIPTIQAGLFRDSGGMLATTSLQLGAISLISLAGIALVAALIWLRRTRLAKNGLRKMPTWGCGYQYGTSRIQYTPDSFVEPATRIFGQVMGTTVEHAPIKDYFPAKQTLAINAPDVVRTKFYEPLFAWIIFGCNWLKRFQNGMVNRYILYILVTLVALLIWGVA